MYHLIILNNRGSWVQLILSGALQDAASENGGDLM
jgi:hypothetical protein